MGEVEGQADGKQRSVAIPRAELQSGRQGKSEQLRQGHARSAVDQNALKQLKKLIAVRTGQLAASHTWSNSSPSGEEDPVLINTNSTTRLMISGGHSIGKGKDQDVECVYRRAWRPSMLSRD